MGKSKELATLTDANVVLDGQLGVKTTPASPLHVKARGVAWEDHVTLEDTGSTKWNILVDQGAEGRLRIRHENNNTNALNIDTGGRITMPFQPSFYVRLLTAVTTRNAVVVFNEVRLNNGGGYNVSNGRYTAPVSGVYLITAGFLPNVDNNSYAYIQVNGTRYSERIYNQYSDQHSATSLHVALDAGDYVEFYTVGDGTEAFYCHFGGHLIG